MKRLKVILALALALGMMVTISVAPALANNNNDNRFDRQDLRVDRQILHDLNNDDNDCCDDFDDNDNCCDFDHNDADFVVLNPFVFNTFANCGHWEWHWVFDRWEWEDDCD
jgi:hypothetical protein